MTHAPAVAPPPRPRDGVAAEDADAIDVRLAPVRSLTQGAEALLARGPAGTAELLRWLGEETHDSTAHAWFYSDRPGWAGAKRVWGDFVASHRDAWVEFLVASLEEIARRPEAFEESAGCNSFLESEYATLPAVLSPDRLDRLSRTMREAVGRWPAEDRERAHCARGLLAGTLATWAESLSTARAVEVLRRGGLSRTEILALLRRLKDDGIAGKDLVAALRELSEDEEDFWTGVEFSPWPVPADAVPVIDPLVLELAGREGSTEPRHVARWLHQTERGGWPAARAFVEKGIERGGRAAEVCVLVLTRLDPRPDAAYVQWLLTRVQVPTKVLAEVKAFFEIR